MGTLLPDTSVLGIYEAKSLHEFDKGDSQLIIEMLTAREVSG